MIFSKQVRLPTGIALAVLAVVLVAASGSVAHAATDTGEDCAMCHENLVTSFGATEHGRIKGFETHDGSTGCVTCHGDGTAHIEAGGEGEIRGLGVGTEAAAISTVCTTCHRSESLHDWDGSVHDLNEVSCTDCHTVHARPELAKRYVDRCSGCHQDVRAQFQYPSHHPLREGHMTCVSCHSPHGTSDGSLRNEERGAELCLSCHSHLQGPFIFEHEPASESCDNCHSPHGAVANNLLQQGEPFLCLQCHEAHFHAGLEGEDEDEAYIAAYDENFDTALPRPFLQLGDGEIPNPFRTSGYKRAFTTKCTQCHTHIHGTDQPSQTTSGLGGGLMR